MDSQPSLNRRDFLRSLSAVGVASAFGTVSAEARVYPDSETSAGEANGPDTETLHRLNPVPIQQVVVEDEFWSPKREVWQQVTLRDCFRKFESYQTGTLNNFDRVRAGDKGNHAGDPWWDGLIYEMIRGSADFMLSRRDPELESQIDGYIERIVAAQAVRPDGYINTYTQLVEPGHEWGLNGGFQLWQHDIYNLGALVDAGLHYYRATGKTSLLVAGIRIANTMCAFMGPPPKKNLVPCHPLPEEAMVRLYELFQEQPKLKGQLPLPVNDAAYLQLAEFWIENRGHNIGRPDWTNHKAAEQFVRNQEYGSGRPSWGAYAQDDAPVFEQKDIHGHAVRATLLCAGIAAALRQNSDERYRQTAVRLWENMVYRRMHITGGVGAFADDERFGPDYTLPNNAYLETCAAVGASFFHHNMNMAFAHSRYADELERSLYNGALPGVSLKGDTYFYQNPLEADPSRTRWSWHPCPCCPPMFLKLMGMMPSCIYATDADSVYVNLFVGSRATMRVRGSDIAIRQTTRYPWDGHIRIAVEPAQPAEFAIMLRIPEWCRGETVRINGQPIPTDQRIRGYLRIARTWQRGDVLELDMPMPVRQVYANPLVQADVGRSMMMRGPLVYCVESADNSDVPGLHLPPSARFGTRFDQATLGGVVVIAATGSVAEPPLQALYAANPQAYRARSADIAAIPYYANANRGPVNMAVWLPLANA